MCLLQERVCVRKHQQQQYQRKKRNLKKSGRKKTNLVHGHDPCPALLHSFALILAERRLVDGQGVDNELRPACACALYAGVRGQRENERECRGGRTVLIYMYIRHVWCEFIMYPPPTVSSVAMIARESPALATSRIL